MKSINRLSSYSAIRKAVRCQEGSVLLFLIVLMVIFTALGVGMVSLFGTSIMSAFSPNNARRANYMAESGLRYTISEVRNAVPTAREALLTNNIDDGTVAGKWFNVFPGLARYQVRVYPYWSKTAAGTGIATNSITATIPNSGFPPGLNGIPGKGGGGVARLQVGPNNLVAISSVTGDTEGSKTVTYTLASNVTIPAGTSAFANIAYPTTNAVTVTKGSTATPLALNINNFSAIPEKNGIFMAMASGSPVDGKLFSYQTAQVTGGNVRLENINWSYSNGTFNFPAGSYLVFSQAARLEATGDVAGGLSQSQKSLHDSITLFGPGSSLPPSGANQTPPALTDDMSGFSNLNALDTTRSGDRVVVAGYIATGGTHAYWAAFQHLGEAGYRFPDPEQPARNIGYHVAPISNAISDNLRNSWMQYHTINYDVQIKMGWDLNLPYAVSGLTFRWHQSPLVSENTSTYQDTYEGYGICFMSYNKDDNSSTDDIPNSIKPPGMSKKMLLVLWQQKISAGVPTKDWLAYAELGYPKNYWNPAWGQRIPPDKDQKVTGYQVWPDGAINDNATIILRVEDKFVTSGGATTRYNDIKVFYGDAAEYNFSSDSRTQDTIATNKERARYYPKWLETGAGGTLAPINPKWPSNWLGPSGATIANWYNNPPPPTGTGTADSVYDYFTLASSAPTAPFNTVTWVKNPSPKTGFENPVNLLSDNCTIRTTDFVIDSFESGRKEIGLFGMGDMNSSNQTVAFDDFYIQILGGY
jgi:hypothetical protein